MNTSKKQRSRQECTIPSDISRFTKLDFKKCVLIPLPKKANKCENTNNNNTKDS